MIKQLRRSDALLDAFNNIVHEFENSDRNFTKLEGLLVNGKLIGKINKAREEFSDRHTTKYADEALRETYMYAMYESLVIETAIKVTLGLRNSSIIDFYDLNHDIEKMALSLTRVFDDMSWTEVAKIKNRVQYSYVAFTIHTFQLMLRDISKESYLYTLVNSETMNTRTANTINSPENEYVTLIQNIADFACSDKHCTAVVVEFLLSNYNTLTDYESHVTALRNFYETVTSGPDEAYKIQNEPNYIARLVF